VAAAAGAALGCAARSRRAAPLRWRCGAACGACCCGALLLRRRLLAGACWAGGAAWNGDGPGLKPPDSPPAAALRLRAASAGADPAAASRLRPGAGGLLLVACCCSLPPAGLIRRRALAARTRRPRAAHPTGTVSSSATLISRSVPATGLGISVSTLSVETSSSGSSTATVSPTALSHRVTVPSETLSPSAGMETGRARLLPPDCWPPCSEPCLWPPDCWLPRTLLGPLVLLALLQRLRLALALLGLVALGLELLLDLRLRLHRRLLALLSLLSLLLRGGRCGLLLAALLLRLLVARAVRAAVTDHCELGTDLDRLVLGHHDALEYTGGGRRDLGVDLVGRDLEQRLVDGDLVTLLLEPAGDSAFRDALTERRHGHGERHLRGVPLVERDADAGAAGTVVGEFVSRRCVGGRSAVRVQRLAGEREVRLADGLGLRRVGVDELRTSAGSASQL
jgi:hypothetical protein